MLGVIAMVWASYPDEDVDPWMQVESRVAHMINAKFDLQRRRRLGDRLRRYVKQFSRCAQAWVADGLVKLHGLSVPRWLVEEAKLAKGSGDFSFNVNNGGKRLHNYPAPACTSELEGHMALERDEWFRTDKGQMSGLFMPFANMHTQLLALLTDHPYDDDMQWGSALKATAAEYGVYMLDHLLSAWKAQVCRTMRLRHSVKSGIYWRYNFVVLKAVEQPHAAEDCSGKCGANDGWCNFCGGKDNGACCQKGDDGVCKMFDTPVSWHGSAYKACVHVDCIQKNTGYYGSQLKQFVEDVPRLPAECQQLCWGVTGAVAFTLNDGGKTCTCLAQKDLQRHQEVGAFSGPTVCKKLANAESILEQEKAFQKNLNETIRVPMEEVQPCPKSEAVSDVAGLEANHADWMQSCYKDATKVVTIEYNKFYQRFAQFVDMQAWKAGCGMPHEVTWSVNAKSNGFEKVSKDFDAGSFADCNWDREESMDKTMWILNEEQARGWLGYNRISMDEQKMIQMKYPMPAWLHDLKNTHACLKKTAAGPVSNPNDLKSTAIDEIMEPAAMDDSMVREL